MARKGGIGIKMRKKLQPFRVLCCIFCISLFCCFSVIICFGGAASTTYDNVRLPNDLEIGIPNDWEITSETDLGLAANCYDATGTPIATLDIKLFPRNVISNYHTSYYGVVQIKSEEGIVEDSVRADAEEKGLEIVSWRGTKKIDLNGLTAFSTEYRWKPQDDDGEGKDVYIARLIKVYAVERTFHLRISYLKSESAILKPMADQIINSINLIEFDKLRDQAAYGDGEDPMLMTLVDMLRYLRVTKLINFYYGPYVYAVFFVVIWLITLVPPVLIRYAIYRKPIKSVWVAILIAAVFLIANTAVMNVLSSLSVIIQGILLLIALGSYLILRKGHERLIQQNAADVSSD